jgi:RNA polymerase sigma-70 factor (ECF subfamily)
LKEGIKSQGGCEDSAVLADLQSPLPNRALRDWLEVNRRRFLTVAMRYVQDRTEAEDIIQNALVRLIKAVQRERFKPSQGGLLSYFYKIIEHTALDFLRAKKNTHITPTEPDILLRRAGGVAPTALEARLVRRDIMAIYQSLGYQEKSVFDMVIMQKKPYDEVAESLGICKGTVIRRVKSIREQFREAGI